MTGEVTQKEVFQPFVLERSGKISVSCREKNRFIPRFLAAVVILTVVSLLYLQIDWLKLIRRIPEVGGVFWELAHLDFPVWM